MEFRLNNTSIATNRAVGVMMAYFMNAFIQNHPLKAASLGEHRIGHAGFFSPKAWPNLWNYVLNLIESR